MNPPADTVPADPALDELREAYAQGNLIVCAGPAVSTAAGLPDRKKLVELLIDHAHARGASPESLDEIKDLLGRSQLTDAISAAKQVLGAPEFHAVIERALDDRKHEVPELARAIAALAPRLRAVITTNLDRLLERAFGGQWQALAHAPEDLAQRNHFILALHGTLAEHETWVLTRDDARRALYANPKAQTAFTSLFNTCPLLFVGYPPGDDDLATLLTRIQTDTGVQPPRHFALVDQASVKPYRRAELEKAGLRLIPYDNPDGSHSAVVRVLRHLLAEPASGLTGASPARPASPYERLTAGLTRLATHVERFLDEYLGTPTQPRAFGGRREELARLDAWLADPSSRYALVIENAGRGKSALLAHWLRQVATAGMAEVVFVPISVRFSTAMLIDALRLLGERFRHLDRATTAHPSEPEEWQAEVRKAFMTDRASPVVIVFDGLDEAADWELGKQLMLPPQLGQNVKVLVAGRPVGARDAEGWRRQLGFGPEALRIGLPALTEDEVADALRSLGASDLAGRPEVVQQLHRISEGDPLLVRLYLDALSNPDGRGAVLSADALGALQPGLEALFESWFQYEDERWQKSGAEALRPAMDELLGICATALGPLLQEDLCAIAEGPLRQPLTLRRVLAIAGRFIIGDGERQGLVFSHPRLRDFWFDRMLAPHERVRWEQRFLVLGQETLRALPRPAPGRNAPSEYTLRFYGAHLQRVNAEPERFYELLSIPWMDAWEQLDETFGGFLMDVERAWTVAERELDTDGRHAVPLLKCGLFEATVASLHDLPPEVVVRLVEKQVWSPERAAARARRIPEAGRRAMALSGVARFLSEPDRTRLQAEALGHAAGLDFRQRVNVLNALTPDLPPQLVAEVLALAGNIPDEEDRATLITSVLNACREVPPESASALITTLIKWKNTTARARVLCAFHRKGVHGYLRQALDDARQTESPRRRAEVLSDMVQTASDDEGIRWQACELLLDIEPGMADSWMAALFAVADSGRADLRDRALERARTISDALKRSEVLCAFARRVTDGAVRARLEEEALDAARAAGGHWRRAMAFRDILATIQDPLRRLHLLPEVRASFRHTTAKNLMDLAAALDSGKDPEETERARLLEETLELARKDPSVENRLEVFSKLRPLLGHGEWERARDETFALLRSMQGGREARQAASSFVKHFSDEQLKELPSLLVRISDLEERAEAVARCALLLLGSEAEAPAAAHLRKWIDRMPEPSGRADASYWLSFLVPTREALETLDAAVASLRSLNASEARSVLPRIELRCGRLGGWESALRILADFWLPYAEAYRQELLFMIGELSQSANSVHLLQLEKSAHALSRPYRDMALAKIASRHAQLENMAEAQRVMASMGRAQAIALVEIARTLPEGSPERDQAERKAREAIQQLPESEEKLLALQAAVPFLDAREIQDSFALSRKSRAATELFLQSASQHAEYVERLAVLGQIESSVNLAQSLRFPRNGLCAMVIARVTGDWIKEGPHATGALALLSAREIVERIGVLQDESRNLTTLPPPIAAKLLRRLIRAHAPGGRSAFLEVTGVLLAPLILAAAGPSGLAQAIEAIAEICNGKD